MIWYQRTSRPYRYTLADPYSVRVTGLRSTTLVSGGCVWLEIDAGGWLHIRVGYAWDGPSGPVRHRPVWMRASLVHDALYQLLREGKLPASARGFADDLFRRHLLEDGMSKAMAWIAWQAVRRFGRKHAARALPVVLTAP